MTIINDKYDLLKFIYENQNENGEIYQALCVSETNIDDLKVAEYAKHLVRLGYIESDITNYYITKKGINFILNQ